MAHVASMSITASRKACENYQTREASVTLVIDLEPGDVPGHVFATWMRKAQAAIDKSIGDAESDTSFAQTNDLPRGNGS